MERLGLSRRPLVPDRREQNLSDADIQQLLPLLQQQANDVNESSETRIYVVKRVHALLPTCEFSMLSCSLTFTRTCYVTLH